MAEPICQHDKKALNNEDLNWSRASFGSGPLEDSVGKVKYNDNSDDIISFFIHFKVLIKLIGSL